MKKSKIFARKVIAIVLSVLMAASSFFGAVTAFAKSGDDNHDEDLAANFMAWAETTDNQTAEALLDWADKTLQNANIAPIIFQGNYVVVNIDLKIYLDSIDGAIDAVRQVQGLLDSYGGLLGGNVNDINLHPLSDLPSVEAKDASGDEKDLVISRANRSYRARNDAKTIVMALAQAIYWNSNDDKVNGHQNKNVIGAFVKGNLSLGSILNGIVDVYGLIGDALGMWSGYQSNLVYNILAQLILTKTNWYTDEQIEDYQSYLQGNGGSTWNFDIQLLEKLSEELLQKISINMTYALEKEITKDPETGEDVTTYKPTDSSASRYKKIKDWLEANGKTESDATIAEASTALGYDPNLRYDSGEGYIYIFRYGNEKLEIKHDQKLYEVIDNALKIAWKTTLKQTLRTLRVNDSMDWYKDHGGNFDNRYYYWLLEKGMLDESNWENNYTAEKFAAYAEAMYADYGCADAEEFTAKVKKTLVYDRTVVEDPQYNWRDIDASCNYVTESGRRESILFGALRYSPLADKVFGIQTGPLNLYIMQTGGASHVQAFMDKYIDEIGTENREYNNIIAIFNNFLIAAVEDFFPDSANIGLTDGAAVSNIARPALQTVNSNNPGDIATVLIQNVAKMLEYVANTSNENILNAFYHNNGITDKVSCTNLTEANVEEAAIPLLVGCIRLVRATDSIHETDWDYAKDAEGVGYVALREYLSYVLPKKDYDQHVKVVDGEYKCVLDVDKDGKMDMYTDVILPMARDAVGYLLNSIVPCRDKAGNVWDVYASDPATDKTTLFDLLNSVVCYYASTETFTEPEWNTTASKTYGKGVAALLGAVDENGDCTVKLSNDLWTNISNIANAVWPTIGVLQTGKVGGKADARKLIYENVVESLLNIGNINNTTKKRGITTIIEQIITIVTAEPLMNKDIVVLVYDDVLASLINGILGKKTTESNTWQHVNVIPTSAEMGNTTTPFDSLVNRSVIALYKGSSTSQENGVLGCLVNNVFEAFGGNGSKRGAGSWQGAMFAVKAVSYFVDGFIPQLGDHKFAAATIKVNDPSRSNVAAGQQMENTYLTLSNNATGLNRFYKNEEGKIVADDRYFIEVKNVSTSFTGSKFNMTVDTAENVVLAPGQNKKLNITAKYPASSSLVTFKMTYDVYLGTKKEPKKTLLYAGQTAECYLNLDDGAGGWFATLEGRDELSQKRYQTEDSGEVESVFFDDNDDSNYINVYNNLLIANNNPGQMDEIGIEEFGLDGLYAADANGDAYVVSTDAGEVISNERYDYKIGEGAWYRGGFVNINGVRVYQGYTFEEAKAATEGQEDVQIRNHVAISVEEDNAGAVIKTANKSGNKYTTLTVDPAVITNGCATASTPTTGITFVDIAGTEAGAPQWLKYDGSTKINAGSYVMNLCGYIGETTYELGQTNVIIADTTGADELQAAYEKHLAEMAPYQATDYTDYNADNESSATDAALKRKFREIVQGIAKPVSLENASDLVSTMVDMAAVSSTDSETGDVAFAPIPSSVALKGNIAKTAVAYNGYWYIDEAHQFPIYGNEYLTAAGVKNGMDAVGQKVRLGNDGNYYLVNDVQYIVEWDTTSYKNPYRKTSTTTPAIWTDDEGVEHPLYNRVQFQYHTANDFQVSSSDAWDYKYAITNWVIKPNDTKDYRGLYTQLADALDYTVEQAKTKVDTALISKISEEIIEYRKGNNSVNYDVATYEKMVQIAQQGEDLVYWVEYKDGKDVYATTASSVEIREANRLFKKYDALVIKRGYEGNKLEAEVAEITGTSKANVTGTVTEDSAEVAIAGAATPAYGAIVGGKLVNAGSTVYTEESWNAFINALAYAAEVQTAGTAPVSEVYEAKKNLVIAENNLTEPQAATSYTVTGTLTEAVDGKGTAGTVALAGVGIYNANGERIGSTAADGSFTVELGLDENWITFKGNNVIERSVYADAENAEIAVGVIAVDMNNDGKINAIDVAMAAKAGKVGTVITGPQLKAIVRTGVTYNIAR